MALWKLTLVANSKPTVQVNIKCRLHQQNALPHLYSYSGMERTKEQYRGTNHGSTRAGAKHKIDREWGKAYQRGNSLCKVLETSYNSGV